MINERNGVHQRASHWTHNPYAWNHVVSLPARTPPLLMFINNTTTQYDQPCLFFFTARTHHQADLTPILNPYQGRRRHDWGDIVLGSGTLAGFFPALGVPIRDLARHGCLNLGGLCTFGGHPSPHAAIPYESVGGRARIRTAYPSFSSTNTQAALCAVVVTLIHQGVTTDGFGRVGTFCYLAGVPSSPTRICPTTHHVQFRYPRFESNIACGNKRDKSARQSINDPSGLLNCTPLIYRSHHISTPRPNDVSRPICSLSLEHPDRK